MELEVIVWACVGVFVATSAITVFGIIEQPRIICVKEQWLKPLYGALILEVVAIGVLAFRGDLLHKRTSVFVSPAITVERSKNADGDEDFFRMFFLREGTKFSGRLGRPDARRVFVSPSAMFTGALKLGDIAMLVGNDYRKTEDVLSLAVRSYGWPVTRPSPRDLGKCLQTA